MKNTHDHRKQTRDKSGRLKKAQIRDRDERNIKRYGECPVKFQDFIKEKINENENENDVTHWATMLSKLGTFRIEIESLTSVAERNPTRMNAEQMLPWLIEHLKESISKLPRK